MDQQPELLIQGVPPSRYYFRPPAGPPSPGLLPPPPPPVALLGHLQVKVNLNVAAQVRLNGVEVGEAAPGRPLNLPNLPVGEHGLEVAAADEGQAERHRVAAGRWTQVVVLAARAPDPSPAAAGSDGGRAEQALGQLGRGLDFEPEMVPVRGGCFDMEGRDQEI